MTGETRDTGVMSKTTYSRLIRGLWAGMAAALTFTAFAETAEAQEILVTGPLAGAPAVRKLRLYREGRFELAPAVSFTLLDEYQRQIFVGLRLNYNFTDWLALGAWGGFSPGPLKISTGLSDEIERVQQDRQRTAPNSLNRRITKTNLDNSGQTLFTDQLGTIDWVVAPQFSIVPFRGKIAIFQSIYVDTDLYFFLGPAFVGVKERGECAPGTNLPCDRPESFAQKSRVAIAPTFGLGFSFFVNSWNALGAEWRGLPFSRNTGGFDNHGGDPDGKFPDYSIDADDREFKFNQMITISWSFYLPTTERISE